jgi:hypothetical protein
MMTLMTRINQIIAEDQAVMGALSQWSPAPIDVSGTQTGPAPTHACSSASAAEAGKRKLTQI